jgi:TonB family protein
MSAMKRLTLPAVFIAVAFFLSISLYAQGQNTQQYLRDQYQGKTFVLRGFLMNDKLRYDSSGSPDHAAPGDWTSDGFVQVSDITLSDDRLVIKAQRMAAAWAGKFELRPLQHPKVNSKGQEAVVVEINADSGMHNPSPEQVEGILSKIFLTAQDSLADIVPDYWKPCVSRGLKGTEKNCVFSPEILSVPGVAGPGGPDSSSATSSGVQLGHADSGPLFAVKSGITPPRTTYQRDPEFSDRARAAKYQGNVVLSLVVNKDGAVSDVHISQPLGYGLDAKAVDAVRTWKFIPAEKDGVPVNTIIGVEVNFHLY